jgi:hypothetical protein
MRFYQLMKAWKDSENHDFNFHNAHDINSARDSSQEESIKKQLRERFANSKQLIVLIGEKNPLLTKFVRWELEVALKLDLPIMAVNLNGSRYADERCPPAIRGELAIFMPFQQRIIAHAMDRWPADHAVYRKQCKTGASNIRTRPTAGQISPNFSHPALQSSARHMPPHVVT